MPASVFVLFSCVVLLSTPPEATTVGTFFCAWLRHITHLNCRDCCKDDPEAPRPRDTNPNGWFRYVESKFGTSERLSCDSLWIYGYGCQQFCGGTLCTAQCGWRRFCFQCVFRFEVESMTNLLDFPVRTFMKENLTRSKTLKSWKCKARESIFSLKSIWHTSLKVLLCWPTFLHGNFLLDFQRAGSCGRERLSKAGSMGKESSCVQRFAETKWFLS